MPPEYLVSKATTRSTKLGWSKKKNVWSTKQKLYSIARERLTASFLILIPGLFEIIAQSADGSTKHFCEFAMWILPGNRLFVTFYNLVSKHMTAPAWWWDKILLNIKDSQNKFTFQSVYQCNVKLSYIYLLKEIIVRQFWRLEPFLPHFLVKQLITEVMILC